MKFGENRWKKLKFPVLVLEKHIDSPFEMSLRDKILSKKKKGFEGKRKERERINV